MARKNIFELLAEQDDLEIEANRLDTLFDTERTLIEDRGLIDEDYTLKKFVDTFCFEDWKNRGHCIDLDDFLECIGYTEYLDKAIYDSVDDFLVLIEIIFNCWQMAEIYLKQNEEIRCYKNFYHLHDVMVECLSRYNHKAVYDEEKEQVLVIEDRPEITAAAEIVKPELALAIVRYNHHSMRGDIAQKKSILLALGAELEPKRKTLSGANSNLEDGIFFMLNNLNLRHNNCSKGDKHYREFVANMDNDTLEGWYDELYQMMLLAFLELDQLERNSKIKELKANVDPNAH